MRKFPLAIPKALAVLLGLLWLGSSVSMAQVTVSLPDIAVPAGSSQDIPITVGDLTGQNVTAYSFTVSYDPAVLTITGASVDGTLSEGSAPTVNTGVSGQVTVAWAKAEALEGAGTLIKLNATYDALGASALSFGGSFVFNEGVPAATEMDGMVDVPAVGVFMPVDAMGGVGQQVMLPITATDLTDQGILAYQFTASYDPAVLTITGMSVEGTLSEGGSFEVNTTVAGQVTASYARTEPIVGAGTLFYLWGTVNDFGETALTWDSFLFNEGTPTVAAVNGNFIALSNAVPVFDAVSGDVTIEEGQTYDFLFSATDPEGEPVTLTLIAGGDTPNVSFTDGMFSFSPDNTQGDASYAFTVQASDGATLATTSFTVTVLNVIATYEAQIAGVNQATTTSPPVPTPGNGAVNVVHDGNMLVLTGSITNLSAEYAASHIHVGGVGTSGGVALTLTLTPNADNRGGTYDAANNTFDLSTDLGSMTIDDFAAALANGGLYVNVHTTAYGSGEVRGQLHPLGNQAPNTSAINSPSDGSSWTITGNGEDELFSINWDATDDPDGNAIIYIFELSAEPTFGDMLVFEAFADPTAMSVSVQDAADIFDMVTDRDPGNIDLGGMITLYHRVITSDGSRWSVGPTASVVLTRDTVTDTETDTELPTEFSLRGNYPNPFNPVTTIQFDLPEAAQVSITVLDMLGRQVMSVPAQRMQAGANRTVQLEANALASGIYLYRVVAQTAESTLVKAGTMTLLK